jgi:hypothetical protein
LRLDGASNTGIVVGRVGRELLSDIGRNRLIMFPSFA